MRMLNVAQQHNALISFLYSISTYDEGQGGGGDAGED